MLESKNELSNSVYMHISVLVCACVIQSLSHVQLFLRPWMIVQYVSLSLTSSWSLLKLTFIETVMPPNHLIFYYPLLLPSIFPSIRVFFKWVSSSHQMVKYWSFSFSISPSNEYSGLISFRIEWFDLLAVQGTYESSPAPQFESISSSVLGLLYDLCIMCKQMASGFFLLHVSYL